MYSSKVFISNHQTRIDDRIFRYLAISFLLANEYAVIPTPFLQACVRILYQIVISQSGLLPNYSLLQHSSFGQKCTKPRCQSHSPIYLGFLRFCTPLSTFHHLHWEFQVWKYAACTSSWSIERTFFESDDRMLARSHLHCFGILACHPLSKGRRHHQRHHLPRYCCSWLCPSLQSQLATQYISGQITCHQLQSPFDCQRSRQSSSSSFPSQAPECIHISFCRSGQHLVWTNATSLQRGVRQLLQYWVRPLTCDQEWCASSSEEWAHNFGRIWQVRASVELDIVDSWSVRCEAVWRLRVSQSQCRAFS